MSSEEETQDNAQQDQSGEEVEEENEEESDETQSQASTSSIVAKELPEVVIPDPSVMVDREAKVHWPKLHEIKTVDGKQKYTASNKSVTIEEYLTDVLFTLTPKVPFISPADVRYLCRYAAERVFKEKKNRLKFCSRSENDPMAQFVI